MSCNEEFRWVNYQFTVQKDGKCNAKFNRH
jgi:hypothetical protein